MISPRLTTSGILYNSLDAEKDFTSYYDKRYVLTHNRKVIFEVYTKPFTGFCQILTEGQQVYRRVDDFFFFLSQIRDQYPEVADWFLFNIKKFT
jgi:hypothetical protein